MRKTGQAAGAATALASALPATESWPLPTGLGGVVGDAVLTGAKAVTGLSSGAASAILGLLFAGIAILSLTAACGLGLAEASHRDALEDFDEPQPSRRKVKASDWDEAEESGPDEPGWGIVSLGALAHGVMSLRATARRWSERRHAPAEDEDFEPAPQPRRAHRDGAMRREPVLDAPSPRASRTAPAAAPAYEDEDDSYDGEPMAQPVPRAAMRPEPVSTMPPV